MPRGIKKGLNTAKFDRCVRKVKDKSGKNANPYAVCNSTMSGKSKREKVKTHEKQESEDNIDSFYEPEYYHQT